MHTLEPGKTLWLAVEGKSTNLKVWTGHNGNGPLPIDTVFMRLDKANNYNAPFTKEIFHYLNNPPKAMQKLLDNGFEFITCIERLPDLMTILNELKERPFDSIIYW